jgi:hypothetical protein
MKKTVALLLMLCAASLTTVGAQDAKVVSGKIRCSNHSEVVLPEGMNFTMKDFGNKKSLTLVKPIKAKAQEKMDTIRVKVVNGNATDAYVYNKDMIANIEIKKGMGSVAVPQGKYDVYVDFDNAYVFKENVQLTGNVELEFDKNDANIPIELNYYDENGKQLHLDITNKGKVEIPKTADDMLRLTAICHKDYGNAVFYMDFCGRRVGETEDFFINNVSDKYYVAQCATANVGSHYYTFKGIINDITQKVYNSNPKNIFKLVTDFKLSPKMPEHKYVGLPGIESSFILGGYSLASTSMWGMGSDEDNGKVITFIDCPETIENDPYKVNVMARPIITDSYTYKVDSVYGESEEFTFIMTPLAVGDASTGAKYYVSGSDMNSMFNIPVGETQYKFYPGHPEFSFSSPDGTEYFGNSVPIMSYRSVQLINDGEVYPIDKFRYLGRLGELRETDEKYATVKKEQTSDGTLVTITNKNVVVDDVPGKNITKVLYNLKKEDTCAPTFQMMTFKDGNGNICDHFANMDGAKMLMAGGDFTYVDNPNYPYIGHFTCSAPASVKAFYAPHDTDNWTELTVVEDPSKYFMPAFGHFYETDLSNVTAKGDNVWFDVRLEMADAVGNYQKQLISPAFMVNVTSSVEQVSTATNALLAVYGKTVMLSGGEMANMTVRSIDGRTLQQAYTNAIDLSNMVSGIYIVTAVAADGTVVSSKVVM